MSEEDRPIIVGGGPHMVNVELPRSFKNGRPGKFSVEPDDPKLPFKEVIVFEGQKEVSRWQLPEEWSIRIV